MIINNNQNIHEAIQFILLSLDKQGTSESTLKNYRTSFHAFEAYLEQHSIKQVTEEICLDYLFSKTGIRPTGFYGYACNRKLNYRMKPLHMLLLYLQEEIFCSEPLKKYPAFSCPSEFKEEYEGFSTYLLEKAIMACIHYAAHLPRTCWKPVRRFRSFHRHLGTRIFQLPQFT